MEISSEVFTHSVPLHVSENTKTEPERIHSVPSAITAQGASAQTVTTNEARFRCGEQGLLWKPIGVFFISSAMVPAGFPGRNCWDEPKGKWGVELVEKGEESIPGRGRSSWSGSVACGGLAHLKNFTLF